jgi:septal ring factor EnvC (AmiA/AmiB activator)
MKSCTFDELCKGLRDRDNDDKEKKTFDELKQKVEKFWRHQLNLDETKLSGLKNKIKTDGKRIESIDEEIAEETKLCDKNIANIALAKKKGGKLFIAAIKKKSADTIKA